MPIYEYKCNECGVIHEEIRPYEGSGISYCPACGELSTKIISQTAPPVLLGIGWDKPSFGNYREKAQRNRADRKARKEALKKEGKTLKGDAKL